MISISASIVVFNTDNEILQNSIDSYLNADLSGDLHLIDNSKNLQYSSFKNYRDRVIYIENSSNPGYGKSHNLILRRNLGKVDFHLVLNPDVTFEKDIFVKLIDFYRSNNSVGIIAPQAIYPNGSFQSNGRLIPNPSYLLLKRLGLLNTFRSKSFSNYMMLEKHGETYLTPVVLGSFMFFSDSTLNDVGLFDERFFLYPEDIDLSRRFSEKYTNFIIGDVKFYHHHNRESYRNLYLTFIHLREMAKYFNKWGWISDQIRDKLNGKITSE